VFSGIIEHVFATDGSGDFSSTTIEERLVALHAQLQALYGEWLALVAEYDRSDPPTSTTSPSCATTTTDNTTAPKPDPDPNPENQPPNHAPPPQRHATETRATRCSHDRRS
jgi:hypothetical protein